MKSSSSNDLNLSPRDDNAVFVDPDHNAAQGFDHPLREVQHPGQQRPSVKYLFDDSPSRESGGGRQELYGS